VLWYPLTQAKLPHKHALTFSRGPARHIGVWLSKEFNPTYIFPDDYTGDRAEDRSSVPEFELEDCYGLEYLHIIPAFLDVLRSEGRGGGNPAAENSSSSSNSNNNAAAVTTTNVGDGVKTVHLVVEGLHKTDWGWGFEAAQPNEERWRWEEIASVLSTGRLLHVPGSPDEACRQPRPPQSIWRLGSSKGALAEPAVLDMVEASPMLEIVHAAHMVGRICRAHGWSEFEGIGVLGSI